MKRLLPFSPELLLISAMERAKAATGAKTWHVEHAIAGALLFGIFSVRFWIFGCAPAELIGTMAAGVTFSYVSLANRLEEQAARLRPPDAPPSPDLTGRLYAKEALWLLYFLLTGATSAIWGALLFLAYGWWRKAWRRTRSGDPRAFDAGPRSP